MEPRTYDFTTLSERISAQTEAYVEFSNALVKIIEQTASIRDRVTEINEHLLEEYRSLNTKFQELLIDINKFISDNHNQLNSIVKDVEFLSNKFHDYESKLDAIIEEMNDANTKLFAMIGDLIKNSKQTNDLITSGGHELTKLHTKIDSQSVKMDEFKTSLDKWKMFLGVCVGLATILGVLTGIKIISISWIVK